MSEAEIIPPFVVIDEYFVGSEGAAMPLFKCIESHDSAMAAMALNDLLARIAERDKTISFQAEATALMADEVMRLVDELTAERDRLADALDGMRQLNSMVERDWQHEAKHARALEAENAKLREVARLAGELLADKSAWVLGCLPAEADDLCDALTALKSTGKGEVQP